MAKVWKKTRSIFINHLFMEWGCIRNKIVLLLFVPFVQCVHYKEFTLYDKKNHFEDISKPIDTLVVNNIFLCANNTKILFYIPITSEIKLKSDSVFPFLENAINNLPLKVVIDTMKLDENFNEMCLNKAPRFRRIDTAQILEFSKNLSDYPLLIPLVYFRKSFKRHLVEGQAGAIVEGGDFIIQSYLYVLFLIVHDDAIIYSRAVRYAPKTFKSNNPFDKNYQVTQEVWNRLTQLAFDDLVHNH